MPPERTLGQPTAESTRLGIGQNLVGAESLSLCLHLISKSGLHCSSARGLHITARYANGALQLPMAMVRMHMNRKNTCDSFAEENDDLISLTLEDIIHATLF